MEITQSELLYLELTVTMYWKVYKSEKGEVPTQGVGIGGNSPKILLMTPVGPTAALRRNIPCLDRPVGRIWTDRGPT